MLPPAAHAPFLAAANPQLFNLDSFTEIGAARPGQDLRHSGVRQMEVVPGIGRFPLCGAGLAPHPHAPALWSGHRAGEGV